MPKLTEEQVLDIYRRSEQGEASKVLAAEYGCGDRHIRKIRRGDIWAGLTQMEFGGLTMPRYITDRETEEEFNRVKSQTNQERLNERMREFFRFHRKMGFTNQQISQAIDDAIAYTQSQEEACHGIY